MADLVVVVSGTRTGVGKTWVAAELCRGLVAEGVAVAARKPAQSFAPTDLTRDADILALATDEDPERVCPRNRSYDLALAPPMAAAKLGRPPFTIADLVAELQLPASGVAVIEGAGGPRSPLAQDGDTVALADAVDADVVILVADAGLGTISDVRLGAHAFKHHKVVVFLNRFDAADALHRDNLEWLTRRDGFEVLTDLQDWYQGAPTDPEPMEAR